MAHQESGGEGIVFFTSSQIASHLGVSTTTVANWTNDGKLNAHRTKGGHRRVHRSELLRFMRSEGHPLPSALLRELGALGRVLVVDDERDFANMIAEVLQGVGFSVVTADSGFTAGLKVATFRPGGILMDLQMPDIDGYEALRLLRADPEFAHVPVIACSGQGDAAARARVREAGFNGCLIKPVPLHDLLGAFQSLLGLPRLAELHDAPRPLSDPPEPLPEPVD